MSESQRILLSALIGTLAVVGIVLVTAPRAVAPTEPIPALLGPTTTQKQIATTTPVLTATTTATTSAIIHKKPTVSAPPTKKSPPPASVVPAAPVTVTAIAQNFQTPATTTPPQPLSTNDKVRQALVNVVCTTKTDGTFESISASGVIVDSRGVILTNSHVAQFFLLKDYPSPNFGSCVIRTGSPAVSRYTAELLFMPPSWMAANAYKINQERPTGSGEHDYALLRITGTVGADIQLPSSFPYLPISTDPPSENQNVLVAAYPAGFLGGITIATNLYAASAEATVRNLYTFLSNTLDLFSVAGTIVSQQGSSGGAVTDENGILLGIIVTASDAPDTASRDLRALSTPYIIGDFFKESGTPLETFLNTDIVQEATSFQLGTAPTLRQELINALQNK